MLLEELGWSPFVNPLTEARYGEIETSPGNYQVGYKLHKPLRDEKEATRLLDRIAAAGLTDKGAKGINRWARMPNGINGKAKHLQAGLAFTCKLFEWNAEVSYSADELLDALAPEEAAPSTTKAPAKETKRSAPGREDETVVYVPKPEGNAVVKALKAQNLYKRAIGEGKHDITCPYGGLRKQ